MFAPTSIEACRKVNNGAERLSMASVMAICGGLLGPKGENVEEVLVLKSLLKGQGMRQPAKDKSDDREKNISPVNSMREC